MRLADVCALLITCLFVLLVMAMLGVEQVCKLSNLLLLVNDADLEVVQVSVLELLLELVEWVLELFPKVGMGLDIWLAPFLGNTGCHCRDVVRLFVSHMFGRAG